MTILWTMEKGRDQIVARLVHREESLSVWVVRLSFNGSRFHSRTFATLEQAATEAKFLQRDYMGRGWSLLQESARLD